MLTIYSDLIKTTETEAITDSDISPTTLDSDEGSTDNVISDITELPKLARHDQLNIINDIMTKEEEECDYSDFGSWSECTRSCGGGMQIRLKRPRQKSSVCQRVIQEGRWCNAQECSDSDGSTATFREEAVTTKNTDFYEPTTSQLADYETDNKVITAQYFDETTTFSGDSTTNDPRDYIETGTNTIEITEVVTEVNLINSTTKDPMAVESSSLASVKTSTTTTTRVLQDNIVPVLSRVKCFTCGSLFSSEAKVCDEFSVDNIDQQVECGVGEVCLHYTWVADDLEMSVIRECFTPDSILLGDVNDPILPTDNCQPRAIDANQYACTCTEDLCNGDINIDYLLPTTTTTISTTLSSTTSTSSTTTSTTTTTAPVRIREDPNRVKCHQCGNLFSGGSAPPCDDFNPDSSQKNFCKPGEACLWYSWRQESGGEASIIRECLPESILLGPIENPLLVTSQCTVKDISEEPDAIVEACFCDSDLCNENLKAKANSIETSASFDLYNDEDIELEQYEYENYQYDVNTEPISTDKQIKCYQCGSLFSGNDDSPACQDFSVSNPDYQGYCPPGDVCLHYTWKHQDGSSSDIRECFSRSILLGSVDDPLVVKKTCEPQVVSEEGGLPTKACLCETDFCNVGENQSESLQSEPTGRPNNLKRPSSPQFDNSAYLTNFTTTLRPRPRLTTTTPAPARSRSDLTKVKCHQCGSLFSGSTSAPDCDGFNAATSVKNYCKEGEACLWYSWRLSDTEVSVIRECLSTTILLGSINDPLTVTSGCQVKDISEDASAQVEACFCDSDLCNDNTGSAGAFINNQPRYDDELINSAPIIATTTSTRRPIIQRQPAVSSSTTPSPRRRVETVTEPDPVSIIGLTSTTQKNFIFNDITQKQTPLINPNLPDKPGLQCFSCGSLFNPDSTCDQFDQSNPSQIQTCKTGEACLYYSWLVSPGEPEFSVRECFDTSVLLGPITDPLLAEPRCVVKDVSEDTDSTIVACLCETDYCNIGSGSQNSSFQPKPSYTPTTTPSSLLFTTTTPPPRSVVIPPSTPSPYSRSSLSCPPEFQSVSGGCFYVSKDRVGWIEARKMCAKKGGVLVSIQSREKRSQLIGLVFQNMRRKRDEFWLSGNDIEEEGYWEWAKLRSRVPDFGWVEPPYDSHEENCLSWTVETGENFWHGSSCCNNLRYICEVYQRSVVK